MNNKKKIAVYVDGFNLYHGIKNLNKPYLKWLNLHSLAEKFIDPKIDHIEKSYYFLLLPPIWIKKQSCATEPM